MWLEWKGDVAGVERRRDWSGGDVAGVERRCGGSGKAMWCMAALVDVLGSAVVAKGNTAECGVDTSLKVTALNPATEGSVVLFTATMLR
eukprot:1195101-Prorocentrum_minimum.AAC.1